MVHVVEEVLKWYPRSFFSSNQCRSGSKNTMNM